MIYSPYYKCRKGCCSNKSAKKVNEQFLAYLSKYEIKDMFLDDLLEEKVDSFEGLNESNKNHEQEIKASLNELQKKIDKVEEKYCGDEFEPRKLPRNGCLIFL